MKKHIFDTLCCSNSKKEAVHYMVVKLFVRYMVKALFLSAYVQNGSSGAEMNRVQDDLRMLIGNAYLKKYGKIRGEVLSSSEKLWEYQSQHYVII